jgi:hypothetical protein
MDKEKHSFDSDHANFPNFDYFGHKGIIKTQNSCNQYTSNQNTTTTF